MARIARNHNGEIRSFDGDRLMVVFPPDRSSENTSCDTAVQTGMEMAWFFKNTLVPKLRRYDDSLNFGIGIAYSPMLAVRAGLSRNPDNNDMVFIGRAANLAAKLSDRGRQPNYIWIDEEIHRRLDDEWKYDDPDKPRQSRKSMWKSRKINFAGKSRNVFSTNYVSEFN